MNYVLFLDTNFFSNRKKYDFNNIQIDNVDNNVEFIVKSIGDAED